MNNTEKAVETRRNKYNGNYSNKKTFTGFTREQWVDKFNKKFNYKFDYSLLPNDINHNTKLIVICPTHGQIETNAHNHTKSKCGCFKCGKKKTGDNQKTSFEDFSKKANKIHMNFYHYDEDSYKNLSEKLNIICPKHGCFKQKAYFHLTGSSCPKCINEKSGIRQRIKINQFVNKANDVHNNYYDYSITKICQDNNIVEINCPKHGIFTQHIFNHLAGSGCLKCNLKNTDPEKIISKLLDKYNIEYDSNNRQIIKPKELDWYISDRNLAIEYGGLYWHSEKYKNKDYHKNKMLDCRKKGVFLLQIFEDEFIHKNKTVLAKIKYKLGLVKRRIYARKCQILKIDSKTANKFLNKYHLQGGDKSSIKYGLIYKKRLVSVMTFCKPKISSKNKYEWEISRYATLNNFLIVGGFGKLLKNFEVEKKPNNLMSYCDNRWYDGESYKKNNFKLIKETEPGYFWIIQNKRFHRYLFAKHKLKDKLKIFDSNKTEIINMHENGYLRIWDCGHKLFLKTYKDN